MSASCGRQRKLLSSYLSSLISSERFSTIQSMLPHLRVVHLTAELPSLLLLLLLLLLPVLVPAFVASVSSCLSALSARSH